MQNGRTHDRTSRRRTNKTSSPRSSTKNKGSGRGVGQRAATAECKEAGCTKPAHHRGWCAMHHARWENGLPMGPSDLRKEHKKRPCGVKGCDRPTTFARYCESHRARLARTGSLGPANFRPKTGKSLSLRSGYVRVWAPKHPLADRTGYVFEHRMVVYDAGIPIPPGYHVHHKNGDKRDNRLKNLSVHSNSEHARSHLKESGVVTNQYGTWTLGRDQHQRWRESYLRQKAKGNR
jgi:HNH endonuclease